MCVVFGEKAFFSQFLDLSVYFLPLLWHCCFPNTLLWLHNMLRLELSSQVGGEMTGVAAVVLPGLQFYMWQLASANSVASC